MQARLPDHSRLPTNLGRQNTQSGSKPHLVNFYILADTWASPETQSTLATNQADVRVKPAAAWVGEVRCAAQASHL